MSVLAIPLRKTKILKTLNLNFNQHIAKYINGNYSVSQLPQIAYKGLEEGFDSESLRILAGMSEKDNSVEILNYFSKTIDELNIKLPEKRNAALIYAEAILHEILDKKKDVLNGVHEIKNDALGNYDFYAETIEYVYDSIGFENIYGLYISYFDILENDRKKGENKKNQQLKSEIINDLKKELLIWKTKIIK